MPPPSAAQPDLPSLAGESWLLRAETQAVFRALADAGFEARAVGGVVRNALMRLPTTDIDLATPAEPQAVIDACAAAGLATYPTGLAHGTVTVVARGHPIEVTTLRRDIETFGRHAKVAFTDDWAADAARRDFTMNALYCSANGTLHDPLGGYPDLLARRVRFIGDARARIREDYLRILRFFRFHAAYGTGTPDPADLKACIGERDGLARLSAERVRAELLKLLVAPGAPTAVRVMADSGILAEVLGVAPRPGIFEAVTQRDQGGETSPDAVLRLSALALAVVDDIPRIADRLRLSNAERDALLVIDEPLLAVFHGLDEAGARRRLYREGAVNWRRMVTAASALTPDDHPAVPWSTLEELSVRWPSPTLPVSGADLIAAGIAPGPTIGRLLAELESWWVEADFPAEPAVRARLAALVAATRTTS